MFGRKKRTVVLLFTIAEIGKGERKREKKRECVRESNW